MARAGRAGRNPLDRFNTSRMDRARRHWENLTDSDDVPPIVDMQPGFNMTPLNEPISPTDCRRWPNSPMCEGDPPLITPVGNLFPQIPQPLRAPINRLTPLATNNFIGINPLSDWGVNNCEAWVCATGNLAFWETPPICVAYRWGDGDCVPNPTEEEEEEEPTPPIPGVPRFTPNRSRDGWVPGCRYFVYIRVPDNYDPGGVITGFGVDDFSVRSSDFGGAAARWLAPVGNQFNGWILPCYGPITGFETLTETDSSGRSVWSFKIFCGGMGHWTEHTIPMQSQVLTPYVVADELFAVGEWIPRTADDRSTVNVIRPAGSTTSRPPPEAVWFRRYGQFPLLALNPGGSGLQTRILSQPGAVLPFAIESQFGTMPSLSMKVVPASAITPWRSTVAWGTLCAPLPVPPPPPPYPSPNTDMGCSCADIEAMIDRKLLALLGFNERRRLTFNPEDLVKMLGNIAYANMNSPKEVNVGTVPQLLAAILATNFYRGGLNRLPATVPSSLRQPDNILDTIPDEKLHDAMSWQEWLFKAIDELSGQYPIAIKYKDGEGEEKDLKFGNASEALAEIIGLLLSINGDTDVIESLAMRGVIESIGARMAAITAADNARANADFLGYRSKETQRTVNVSINPNARNIRDILQETKVKTTRLEFDDKNDLLDVLRQIMLTVGIIKAVFTKDYEEGDQFPGERMREERRRSTAEDTEWTQFIERIENPPENEQNGGTTPDIRDLTPPRPRPTPTPGSTPSPSPTPTPTPPPS